MAQLAPLLRRLGVHTVLMTGEPPVAARALARAAGIDNVMAGVPVERRVLEVSGARGADRVIAVAGDPQRDMAVMLAGDVSIAVSELAPCGGRYGVCLSRGTFADVAPAIALARDARAAATVNATAAIVWNLLLIGVAAAGVLGVHAPLIAGTATALVSSVLAAWTRGRRRRLEV
jgi:Cu+-exporting ATPase